MKKIKLKPKFRKLLFKTIDKIISAKIFPLESIIPFGKNYLYDIQRYSGKKDFEIIFDVGANVGNYTARFKKYFPESKIYSFEPIRSTYNQLKNRFEKKKGVECFNLGFGRNKSILRIKLQKGSQLNSFNDTVPLDEDIESTEVVKVDTVDSFCEAHNIQSIDFLKIDVEGYELEVLEGAKNLLQNDKIQFIYSETGFSEEDSYKVSHTSLDKFIIKYGFKFCGFYETIKYGGRKYLVYSNALYHNPNFSK